MTMLSMLLFAGITIAACAPLSYCAYRGYMYLIGPEPINGPQLLSIAIAAFFSSLWLAGVLIASLSIADSLLL